MKKISKKQIEAIAQELLNVPTDESTERMQLVKERAFQEYERRQRMKAEVCQPVKSTRGSKVKGLGYRMMTAVAIALAILIIPVVFPAPISVADDDWGRSVVIWLNDTFHTEIKLPDSVYDKGGLSELDPGEKRVFYSVEEATTFLDRSLLVLGNEEIVCELQLITVSSMGEDIYRITEEYLLNDEQITVTLKTALSSQTEAPLSETTIINSEVCDLYAWENVNGCRAFGIFEDWVVLMTSQSGVEESISVFSSAHMVN